MAHAAGMRVYVLNARDVYYYAKALSGRAKTDRLDAAVIARYAAEHHERLHAWQPAAGVGQQLHELLQRRACVTRLLVSLRQTLADVAALDAAGLDSVDFVVAGPPCQPFSIAGKPLGRSDDRSDLLFDGVRIIGELCPAAFLIENVSNLLTFANGQLLRSALAPLRRHGYAVRAELVLASEYGDPQNRRHLVVVGMLGRDAVDFPAPSHGINGRPVVTCADAIADLPDAAEYGDCLVHNHEPTAHAADMVERFNKLQPGKREPGSFHDRLHPDRPSFTLRAGSGNFSPLRPVHYKYNRVITARESARLQGFDDAFIWPDGIPRLQQYRQAGNAVPPPLARAFAASIVQQIGWSLAPERCRRRAEPPRKPSATERCRAQRGPAVSPSRRFSRARRAGDGLTAARPRGGPHVCHRWSLPPSVQLTAWPTD